MKTATEIIRDYYDNNPGEPMEVWIKFAMKDFADQFITELSIEHQESSPPSPKSMRRR